MPNIKYSYIFDEELDRVYDCLTNAQLNLGIAYNNLVTKLHFIKGDRFDEENAEFSFIWKNYYEIKMIVQNVKKKENFRTYTNKSLDIDKLSLQISLTYYYYWDTIGQNTLLLLDLEYKDEFFGDLIKTDFSKSDVLNICNNIKNYINSIIQGLDINNSFLVKAPIEELW